MIAELVAAKLELVDQFSIVHFTFFVAGQAPARRTFTSGKMDICCPEGLHVISITR